VVVWNVHRVWQLCVVPVARRSDWRRLRRDRERAKTSPLKRRLHMLDDHFRDECGVFGIFGHAEAANLTYLGLHALQHRGQESAGIVTSDGSSLYAHRSMGLVQDAFSQ